LAYYGREDGFCCCEDGGFWLGSICRSAVRISGLIWAAVKHPVGFKDCSCMAVLAKMPFLKPRLCARFFRLLLRTPSVESVQFQIPDDQALDLPLLRSFWFVPGSLPDEQRRFREVRGETPVVEDQSLFWSASQ
jgi:hypothetical protein